MLLQSLALWILFGAHYGRTISLSYFGEPKLPPSPLGSTIHPLSPNVRATSCRFWFPQWTWWSPLPSRDYDGIYFTQHSTGDHFFSLQPSSDYFFPAPWSQICPLRIYFAIVLTWISFHFCRIRKFENWQITNAFELYLKIHDFFQLKPFLQFLKTFIKCFIKIAF